MSTVSNYHDLDVHFRDLIRQRKIRSAGYCIAKDSNIVACNAMGDMDLGDGCTKEIRTDTIFEIQSITKWITAVALLILRENKLLSLSDHVSRYISEFRQYPFSEITIMHLLTHTSGLVPLDGTFAGRDLNWGIHIDEEDVAGSWIPAVIKMGLSHKPGSRWEYSMMGFCILGEIIARIAGERAEYFIRNNILLPCEMKDTHWKREVTAEWAERYQIRTERHRQQYRQAKQNTETAFIGYCADWKEIPETAGGLMSTLQDVIQFGMMLAADGTYGKRQILQESSLHLLEENQLGRGVPDFCWGHAGNDIAYGAGCAVHDPSFDQTMQVGEKTMYHEGAGSCMLMVNRRDRFAAVWDVPFWNEQDWWPEAITDTANLIWSVR